MISLHRVLAFAALLTIRQVACQCTFCGKELTQAELATPFTLETIQSSGFELPILPSLGRRKLEELGHRQLMDSPEPEPEFLTCQGIADYVAALPEGVVCPTGEDLTTILHICGCPDAPAPPADACNGICEEGSPANPDAKPFGTLLDSPLGALLGEEFDVFRDASCAFMDRAFQLQTSGDCQAAQLLGGVADSCGCGGSQPPPTSSGTCGLCGLGVELPDYTASDTGVPESLRPWCGGADAALSTTTDEECNAALSSPSYQGLQDICGCNGVPTGAGECPVCPGEGSQPTMPESEFITINGLLGEGSSTTITCGDAGAINAFVSVLGEVPCGQFAVLGPLFCGCPETEAGNKALCPSGEALEAPNKLLLPEAAQDLLLLIQEFASIDGGVFDLNEAALLDGITCADMGNLAEAAASGSEFWETSIPFDCECPGISELTCPLCSDGSELDESIELVENYTCGQAQFYVGLANESVCAATVAMEGYCGCPNTAGCRFCGDGVLLEPGRLVDFEFEMVSCLEFEFAANEELANDPTNATICPLYRAAFAEICCAGVAPIATADSVAPSAMGDSAVPSAMMDGSAVPSAMMDGSAAPSAMMDGSAAPSAMMEGSAAPSKMMSEPPSATPTGGADATPPPTPGPTDAPASKAKHFAASISASLFVVIIAAINV